MGLFFLSDVFRLATVGIPRLSGLKGPREQGRIRDFDDLKAGPPVVARKEISGALITTVSFFGGRGGVC